MMKQRVGIITFHQADNLGAVLQAYALQQALEQFTACDAQIIDYRCAGISNGLGSMKRLSIKQKSKALFLRMYYLLKHRHFEKFRKSQLVLSAGTYTSESVGACAEDYDIFISGSDQVWNLECSGWDDAYFLDFVPDNKRRYSYAASLGSYRFKPEEQEHIGELLKRFRRISVREESAAREIAALGRKDAVVHPDPVMLLTAEQWRPVMSKRLIKDKYIFVYLIQQDVNVMREARAYARKHNCRIINNKKSPEFILHGAPGDFLSWIYNAECVFTNSFHGTAFSVLFNKPLAADIQLADGRSNNRVKELLEQVRAENCIIGHESFNYGPAHGQESIAAMRNGGRSYLDEIISDPGKNKHKGITCNA